MAKYREYFLIDKYSIFGTNVRYGESIKDTIVDAFESMGVSFDYKKRLIAYDSKMPSPMFCRADENYGMQLDTIFVNCSCDIWNQLVFQLSHEITHCFIHCANSDRTKHIDWIEETICEAVSLYFLKYFFEKWPLLPLYELDPNYAIKYDKYLNNELSKEGNKQLTLCSSIEDLKQLNAISQIDRESRQYERNKLYSLLNKDSIPALIYYRNFAIDVLLMDSYGYRRAYSNNSAVSYLCDLQDKIVGLNKV